MNLFPFIWGDLKPQDTIMHILKFVEVTNDKDDQNNNNSKIPTDN